MLNKFKKAFLISLAVLVGVFIISKIALLILPFIIAFILSLFLEPIIKIFMLRFKLKRKTAVMLVLIFISLTLGLILTLIISKLISELVNISTFLPAYFTEAYKNLDLLIKKLSQIYINLPDSVTKNIESILQSFTRSLTEFFNSIIKMIINTAISLPEALIFTIVTILSTYFLTSDKEIIFSYIKGLLPVRFINRVRNIKKDMFYALFGYIKAQLILMSITFSELFIGFNIINIHQPLTLALFISLIDALPILGSGSILIPWLIYEFLIGNSRLGVSLLFIYIIVLIVRQMIEPKILSKQIGVHPLLTLMAMYIGLKLFGFIGLILGPITVLLLKNILFGITNNKLNK